MNTERFHRATDVFLAVCDHPIGKRREMLDKLCGGDNSLRDEVLSLLDYDAQADGLDLSFDCAAPIPDRIGRYRIIGLLGEGGMGAVYEAVQDATERIVALKVIRPGLLSRTMLRRFGHEAQILARLKHPGIAQIFEAGTSEHSQPYFAMELVRGLPLLQFADEHGLDLRDRIRLLALVCDAVHHAHLKGVIHRDLKPANIIVEGDDATTAQPKVLDFGVARLVEPDETKTIQQTQTGQLLGTIAYMSPEQLNGSHDLDVRSDVYALGVVAQELLTGALPYDLADSSLMESARIICERNPIPAGLRNNACRGDIEIVLTKALEKDPQRRYQSAADLATDLRRYLRIEPIHARPPSAVYQVRRFMQRNRALCAGAAAAVLCLIIAIVGTSIGLVRAQREAQRATSVSTFLEDMLLSVNPEQQGADLRFVEVIRDAAAEVDERFAGQPETAALLHNAFGNVLQGLDLHSDAATELSRALNLRRAALGPDHSESLETAYLLANSQRRLFRLDEAHDLIADTIARLERTLGATHRRTLAARNMLALILNEQGQYEEAVEILRENLAQYEELVGPMHDDTLSTMLALGETISEQASRQFFEGSDGTPKMVEAEAIIRETVERLIEAYGETYHRTVATQATHAGLLNELDRPEEAEQVARTALENSRVAFDESSLVPSSCMNALAWALHRQGKSVEAAEWVTAAIEALRSRLGENNPRTVSYMSDAINIYAAANWAEEGEHAARTLMSVMAAHGDGYTLKYRNDLAGFLLMQERYDEAMEHLTFLMGHLDEFTSPEQRTRLIRRYGECLTAHAEYEQAEATLTELWAEIEHDTEIPDVEKPPVLTALAELYEAWGRFDEAEVYRSHPGGP